MTPDIGTMYPGLVSKGTETGDGVIEWYIDFDGVGDQVLHGLELGEIIFALNIVTILREHSSDEASE